MPLLLRSWNLFHGNARPPERRTYLREALELVSRDDPDVVCLQEVPAWALSRLEEWTGMTAFSDLATRPSVGPLPSTSGLGRLLTAIHPGVLRSAFSGQANAVLVNPSFRVLSRSAITINSRSFRQAQARWLGLPLLTRLVWAEERRVCQGVRLMLPDGRRMLVANLHATSYGNDFRLADAEILRAATFATSLAHPDDVCVLGGDFNITPRRSRTLSDLARPEWGFSPPAPGIDHLLVRGAETGSPGAWPSERRSVLGRTVSDHAPVEVTIE